MDYRWKIYLVNLDPTIGSEQSKTRPVLVISNEDINSVLPVLTVIPITSFKEGRKIYINEVFINTKVSGLKRDSIILCYQIRTIDKKRLIKEIGEIKMDKKKLEIMESLRYQLDI
ncbi:MAG TPA: type II toxin-antitoxin system PemK/MazF family toxin [Thermotogota bacterium]|nr:type II toxin-antitoxin system PemK/MazF family toxin [Thermotogota bacterium]HRW34790.1 type II toxin-antitoxin system PemK/MazF family toxin [Thermotogota bacterium]